MLPGWLVMVWQAIDSRLRAISDTLQSIVRLLRILRATLVAIVILAIVAAVFAVWQPQYVQYVLLLNTIILVIPLILVTFLVALPLRAKSVVRLIDRGYPSNARELAIRVWARKLRDESIETEELLVETAINEGKKALRKFKERSAHMDDDEDDDTGGARPSTPPSPPPPPSTGSGPSGPGPLP